MTKFCLTCGSQFIPKKLTQKFCSKKCWGNHHSHSNHPTCANCGKIFTPTFFNERFCSDSCRIHFFKLGDSHD